MCKSKPPKPTKDQRELIAEQKKLVQIQNEILREEQARSVEIRATEEAEKARDQKEMVAEVAKQRRGGGSFADLFSGMGKGSRAGGGSFVSLLRRVGS